MTAHTPPNPPPEKLSEVEHNKAQSRYLRGSLLDSIADRLTGSITDQDNQLLKFHGSYQQDDRDLRNERARQKLEPAFSFMIRIRAPGGVVTPQQWLALDQIARDHGGGSLRLTTRQSFELHGIIKWKLQETIRRINDTLLTTIAACGDVNRNVMCNPNPFQSALHGEVFDWSVRLSDLLIPRTQAYHEIWVEQQKVVDTQDAEPIYGPTYLPRKFKIGIAVPPSNDIDVFTQDLGFIAIVENGRLAGFNVVVGGGMGMTHGEPATYPNLAWPIGFHRPEQALAVAENVVKIQRDYGDRTNRKHARLKYTIDDRGIEWFKQELETRLGKRLEPDRPYQFTGRGDRYGWIEGVDGRWHLTLYIESGRIRDFDGYRLLSAMRDIAEVHQGDFRLTANQNLIIANVPAKQRATIDELVDRYTLSDGHRDSALRRNTLACVSLPMCALAMAEAERYQPTFFAEMEKLLTAAGLIDEEIVVRMTGCPNGCARPYVAEIALVGKALGRYNLYLGGDFLGTRLNKLYLENATTDEIYAALGPLLQRYAQQRNKGERFGDFVIRAGVVKAVEFGRDFHA
jgi:sulfite reductase (NADPH) hemoprotein beta-component